jgi:hypothetical protein
LTGEVGLQNGSKPEEPRHWLGSREACSADRTYRELFYFMMESSYQGSPDSIIGWGGSIGLRDDIDYRI